MMVIVFLAMQCVFIVPNFMGRNDSSAWNLGHLEDRTTEIAQEVEKDTLAIDGLTHFLYQEMGWDSQLHMRDFSDITIGGTPEKNAYEHMLQEILKHDTFVFALYDLNSQSVIEDIQKLDPRYKLQKEFMMAHITVVVYGR